VVDIIDKEPRALEGWIIGTWHGAWVIGKPVFHDEEEVRAVFAELTYALCPAYEISLGTQLGDGKVGLLRACFPIKSFSSIRNIQNVQVAILVDDLTREERRTIELAVLQCDALLRQLRANDAGIAVARPGAADSATLKRVLAGRH
jgi:hypothetical protein